jgi:hypothetical protein
MAQHSGQTPTKGIPRYSHNYLSKLLNEYSDMTDEELFQGARRLVIATLQVHSFSEIIQFDQINPSLYSEHCPL